MRKTIAKRLVESKTTIPHFTVTVVIDSQPLLNLRGTINKQLEATSGEGPIKLSVNDFIVYACAIALAHHPQVNSSWTDKGIQQHGEVNVGVAVALPAERGGGLVVPTIRGALAGGLRHISTQTKQLATKARGSGLSVEEMSDGTFTVSNLGMLGVEHFEAIINPPQAAILAVGASLQKPVVRHNQIIIGQEMALTLSCDHRVVDGAIAAEFLATLKNLLESPAAMLV
jgi:pyruvate dehydrogenase E2 component (dihydrolipoamide acetyltransferase)